MFRLNTYILFEFITIFFITPLIFYFELLPSYFILPTLWIITLYALFIYKGSIKLNFYSNLDKRYISYILKRFTAVFISLFVFTYIFYNDKLFTFLLNDYKMYLIVFFLYPILSVIPQEIIFRRFFTYRYKYYMNMKNFILLNSFIFGYIHIIYTNYVALLFSAIAGYLFMQTYLKTRSLSLVVLEHSLYGNLIFTIGLGEFFYNRV